MTEIKVSVIIPVYNVEKYLEQCLDSVINQTLKDIEIICINDGSPDNCGEIIDRYASKDNRIVAVHKQNGGYASAINYGLNIARGEYIGIVESDDWIAPDMYEKLYQKAVETDSDMVKGAFWYVDDSANDVKRISKFVLDIYNMNSSFTLKECPKLISHFASIWSCVYKRSWLVENNIKMVEDVRPYEDNPFIAETASLASKITILPEPFYFYRMDAQNSSCNTVKRSIVSYVTQRSRNREALIRNNCWTPEIIEYYWRVAYLGCRDFYRKPNNKFRKEFYGKMRELLKKAKGDGCTFKYLSRVDKRDFAKIVKYPYEIYNILKFIEMLVIKIFNIKNDKKHKIITILGIKIKLKRNK